MPGEVNRSTSFEATKHPKSQGPITLLHFAAVQGGLADSRQGVGAMARPWHPCQLGVQPGRLRVVRRRGMHHALRVVVGRELQVVRRNLLQRLALQRARVVQIAQLRQAAGRRTGGVRVSTAGPSRSPPRLAALSARAAPQCSAVTARSEHRGKRVAKTGPPRARTQELRRGNVHTFESMLTLGEGTPVFCFGAISNIVSLSSLCPAAERARTKQGC